MTGVLLLAAVLYLLGYSAACTFWPYASCRKCDGAGKFRSPTRKHWRPCRRCSGSGRRIRTGRVLAEWLRFGSRQGRE